MRLGIDTPVPVTSASEAEADHVDPVPHVGTNIDCQAVIGARALPAHHRRRELLGSSVREGPFERAPPPPVVEANPTGSPVFRRFDTN
jgi:hypothetical protein